MTRKIKKLKIRKTIMKILKNNQKKKKKLQTKINNRKKKRRRVRRIIDSKLYQEYSKRDKSNFIY